MPYGNMRDPDRNVCVSDFININILVVILYPNLSNYCYWGGHKNEGATDPPILFLKTVCESTMISK